MTALWTSLIVIGLLMIVVAVWPSIHGRDKPEPAVEDEHRTEGH